jgi:transposase
MAYSSNLTDKEWAIFEPLLLKILPPQKANSPACLDEARDRRWHSLSTEKRLQLGRFTQRAATLFNSLLALQTMACRWCV